MLTRSGLLIVPGGTTAPALHDLALGMGRMPRFAGQGRGWWTVLHHSFVCERLMPQAVPRLRLLALLHDAHEAITGDVPTPWKPPELRRWQDELDARIFPRYGLTLPLTNAEAAHLRVVDRAALLAEGAEVGPPGFAREVGEPLDLVRRVVRQVRDQYPDAVDTIEEDSWGVVQWKNLVRSLMTSDAKAPQCSM